MTALKQQGQNCAFIDMHHTTSNFSIFTAGVAVLDYLNKQNRPYSAIDICNNLHKEFGKTVEYDI